MSEELRQLFPAAYEPHRRVGNLTELPIPEEKIPRGRSPLKQLSTRARMILTMELRGFDKKQIAQRLQMTEQGVVRLTGTDRYIAHRDKYLERMDAEMLAMKPLAFNALRGGLTSQDENTALRASEQWMKAAGFMHYGKAAQGSNLPVTAEEVAARLQANVVNVQVNLAVPPFGGTLQTEGLRPSADTAKAPTSERSEDG